MAINRGGQASELARKYPWGSIATMDGLWVTNCKLRTICTQIHRYIQVYSWTGMSIFHCDQKGFCKNKRNILAAFFLKNARCSYDNTSQLPYTWMSCRAVWLWPSIWYIRFLSLATYHLLGIIWFAHCLILAYCILLYKSDQNLWKIPISLPHHYGGIFGKNIN